MTGAGEGRGGRVCAEGFHAMRVHYVDTYHSNDYRDVEQDKWHYYVQFEEDKCGKR